MEREVLKILPVVWCFAMRLPRCKGCAMTESWALISGQVLEGGSSQSEEGAAVGRKKINQPGISEIKEEIFWENSPNFFGTV